MATITNMTTDTQKRFSQDSKHAMRNPWVIGWLTAVLLVLIVNAVFIITAIQTNPGLVEADYYEKGRDHEQNFLKKAEARSRLGWQLNLQLPARMVMNRASLYTLNVIDNTGSPLTDAEAVLVAYRPSDAAADFNIPLQEYSSGLYQAEVSFPLKGVWDLTARVTRGEHSLDVTQRISVLAN
jgi:nitrogen fixation protein FixH